MLKLNIKQLFLALQTESTIPALLSETLNILPDCPKLDLAISLLAGGKSTPKIVPNWKTGLVHHLHHTHNTARTLISSCQAVLG